MAEAAAVQKRESGWLKRLRVAQDEGGARKAPRMIVTSGSKAVHKGMAHVEASRTLTTASNVHRGGAVRSVGFLRNLLWSVGRNHINTFTQSEAPSYYEAASQIKLPEHRREFTKACDSGADRLYCLTEGSEIYTANLEVGEMEGRIPFFGSKYDFQSFRKIVAAPSDSAIWSLLAALDDRGRIHVLDNRTNSVVRKLNAGTALQAMRFHPDSSGGGILAGSATGELFKWDLRSEECLLRHKLTGSLGIVDLDIRSEENLLVVSDASAVITQHQLCSSDGANGKKDEEFKLLKEYKNVGTRADLLVGHKSLPLILAGSTEHAEKLKMINLADRCIYQNWPGPRFDFGAVTAAAYHPSESRVALGNDRGVVKIWQFDTY